MGQDEQLARVSSVFPNEAESQEQRVRIETRHRIVQHDDAMRKFKSPVL